MQYFWQETILLLLALFNGLYLLTDRLYYHKPLRIGWSDILIAIWLLLVLLYGFRDPSARIPAFSLFFIAWCFSKCSNIRWVWLLWAGLYLVCMYSTANQLLSSTFTRLFGFTSNPGILGNLLIPFFCLLSGAVLYAKKKAIKHIALLLLVPITISLLLTQARAAWIGAFVGLLFLVSYTKPVLSYLKKQTKSRLLALVLVAICVLGLMSLGLYKMRPAPADGRMLIYTVSAKAVLENPLGHGLGSAKAAYPQYQAAYLEQYPDSKYAILADDAKNAFLDLLQVGFEMGWFAMLLYIVSILFLMRIPVLQKHRAEILGLKAALIGIFAASFFSYPLYQWLPSMQIAVLAGMLLSYDERCLVKTKINKVGYVVFALLLMVFITYIVKRQHDRYKSYLYWDELRKVESTIENKEYLVDSYNQLTTQLPHNGLLQYHYGITLFELNEYEKSISVLRGALNYYTELNLWMCLAENYRALKRYDEAVVHFSKAYHMAPKRFMPLYKLMLVSREAGKIEQAKQYAVQILSKVVKIPSTTVDAIKLEAQTFLLEN